MIDFIAEYGLFMLKTITLVAAILITVAGIFAISMRNQGKNKDQLEVKHLNKHYDDLAMSVNSAMLSGKLLKNLLKQHKKADKEKKKEEQDGRRLFVIDFHGDIRASAVASLREEITAILTVAKDDDEVLVKLESAGGLVHGYGLAASQLKRLRDKNIKLTVAVDKVAASGGYMMACVADQIIAAPFAIVGSIGVLAQLPNFNRWLKKNEIDYEQFTAGEYKRTVTIFGENSDQDRAKFQQDLEETHVLFKDFVSEHRPQLEISKVSTGEHWYGKQALNLQLVDRLQTSDDYLLAARTEADLYTLKYTAKKSLVQKLMEGNASLWSRWSKAKVEPDWEQSLPRI